SQPDSAEQALEICEYLVRSSAVDVVVVDSVAALVPKAEIDGDMGDSHIGLQARLMSQALRKLTAAISRSNTSVVFINQIREKVGVIWGSPEVTPGGRALKFYSSVRIDLRRLESLKQAGEIVGSRVRARVVKNKVAPPFKVAEFDIMFNQGISKEGELVEMGTEMGVVKKSGAFYSFGEVKLGQGRENVKEFLKENPDIAQRIESMVIGHDDSVAEGPPAENGHQSPAELAETE
ncbi:MAG: recombinase RecA, partial [SAR202 cluster bacterium]|nr:recombinase RecA [SAR202 cluster bacterium]